MASEKASTYLSSLSHPQKSFGLPSNVSGKLAIAAH
jgi:hypothetical protein